MGIGTGRRPRLPAAFLPLVPGTTAVGAAARTLVPPRKPREVVDAVRAGGGDARLALLPGRDPSIPDARDGAEPHAWLLRHTRTPRRAAAPP